MPDGYVFAADTELQFGSPRATLTAASTACADSAPWRAVQTAARVVRSDIDGVWVARFAPKPHDGHAASAPAGGAPDDGKGSAHARERFVAFTAPAEQCAAPGAPQLIHDARYGACVAYDADVVYSLQDGQPHLWDDQRETAARVGDTPARLRLLPLEVIAGAVYVQTPPAQCIALQCGPR